jgi:hypothetical protein
MDSTNFGGRSLIQIVFGGAESPIGGNPARITLDTFKSILRELR